MTDDAEVDGNVVKMAGRKRRAPQRQAAPADEEWRDLMLYDQYGKAKASFGNLCLIFRNHARFKGRLGYNEMSLAPQLDGKPVEEAHFEDFREWFEREERIIPPVEALQSAMLRVARETSWHPIKLYLEGLRWDGEFRLIRLATDVLGSKEHPLTASMMRKTMIAAVARIFEPGCKLDTVSILAGEQDRKKSTFWTGLFSKAWFNDSTIDVHDKDGKLIARKFWCSEWAEIDAIFASKDRSVLKGFVTSPTDNFRAPYAKNVESYPRSSIFVGTTNEPTFLVDPTGSRRYWVIPVEKEIDVALLEEWRDQLWAEAVMAYRDGRAQKVGFLWWLSPEEESMRRDMSEQYQVEETWEDDIAKFAKKRTLARESFSTNDVQKLAMDMDASKQTVMTAKRVSSILRKLGYDQVFKRVDGALMRLWLKADQRDLPSKRYEPGDYD